jgi:hypothetical protein
MEPTNVTGYAFGFIQSEIFIFAEGNLKLGGSEEFLHPMISLCRRAPIFSATDPMLDFVSEFARLHYFTSRFNVLALRNSWCGVGDLNSCLLVGNQ